MDVLVEAKIIEESKNNLNEKVYGIMGSIKRHIDYREQDEKKIEQQFIKLIADGNQKANERVDIKLNANDSKNKRKRINQQDADKSLSIDTWSNINSVHSIH